MSSRSTSAPPRNWRRTLSNALILTRREVQDSFRDWRIIGPIVVLTFFFPFLAQAGANLIANFLAGYGAEFVGGQFIPFLLMVVGFFPISISLVIALETFVGEKERRSLEPLLSTPLSNTELYIGKTLAAMLPPLLASFTGMSFYLLTLALSGSAWQPSPVLAVQIYLLTIAQALVMVSGAVVVSSQTTSTRAANLLASFIIIPMTLFINAESVIIFLAPDAKSPYGITALWGILVGMVVTAVLLLRVGNSMFNREELLGRSIDSLNLIRVGKKIVRYARAVDADGTPATGLLDWYRRAIPYSLGRLRTALWVTGGVFLAYFLAGVVLGTLPQFQLGLEGAAQGGMADGGLAGLDANATFGFILWQNTRVLLLALVASAFTLGVAAYVLVPTVFIVLGYLASQMIPAGLGAELLVAVLPHGIVEIPVVLLAAAASFQVGAVMTKPPSGQTVGHAWITALGAAVKLGVGVVLPGLVLAALLEAYVTVPLLRALVGG